MVWGSRTREHTIFVPASRSITHLSELASQFTPPFEGSKAYPPVPAHHPIRFLLAQQWHQEIRCQLIHHVQPQLIKAHLQQCPEPAWVVGSQRKQQLSQQRDGRQRFQRHSFDATAASVPRSSPESAACPTRTAHLLIAMHRRTVSAGL